ncbi:hypothetical protein BDQ94DRAFT_46244 [Aspergillus welwitschiae]|uniref:Uncharacterized protein n=1 Tax=Aspergillus welwitschiae TaxID=1341132 RepID=A0A3F3QIX3_9EURO|nr:hypothetical protein BDQ94DRAFT_46244 [Aspergillus welwitschiae]RDH38626.1 hypothetical protein BDQ94DRAFT_46244 [Aspergillus welwitschiae]
MGPFLFFHLFPARPPTAAKSTTVPGNITCSIIPDTVNTRLITVNWRLRNPAAFNGQLIGGGALWKKVDLAAVLLGLVFPLQHKLSLVSSLV